MISPIDFAKVYLKETLTLFEEYKSERFQLAMDILISAYNARKTVFICGNGGSAGTSNHMVNDLGKGTVVEGKQRLKVFGLADNISTITAYANDCGYESIFVEQLKSQWERGSVLIAISASGNSENVVRAAEFAKKNFGTVIGLVGFEGGRLKELSDVAIHFASKNYGSVEDAQLMFGHLASQYINYYIRELGTSYEI